MTQPQIAGIKIARRKLYEAPTDKPSWAVDMLIAINAAKGLGFSIFEIALSGQYDRPQPKDISGWMTITLGPTEESWEKEPAAPDPKKPSVVTVYAVVVE